MGTIKVALPSSGPKVNHTRRGENGESRRGGKDKEGGWRVYLLLGAWRGGGLECASPKGLSWEQTLESITTSVVPQDDREHCDLQVGNVLCPADL